MVLNVLYALTLFNPYKSLWHTSFLYPFYRWECWGIWKVSWLVQRHWHRQHLNADTLASEPTMLTVVWFLPLMCHTREWDFGLNRQGDREGGHWSSKRWIIDNVLRNMRTPETTLLTRVFSLCGNQSFSPWSRPWPCFQTDEIGVSRSSLWPSCTLMDTQRSIGILDRGDIVQEDRWTFGNQNMGRPKHSGLVNY